MFLFGLKFDFYYIIFSFIIVNVIKSKEINIIYFYLENVTFFFVKFFAVIPLNIWVYILKIHFIYFYNIIDIYFVVR